MSTALLIVICCGAACLPCQQPSWRIPVGGAVEYERDTQSRSGVAPTEQAAGRVALDEPVPERYLSALVPAPVLCQGELDVRQRTITTQVQDLRDVIRNVALDLSTGRSGSWLFGRIVPFGDLKVTGAVRADGAGVERMQLTVVSCGVRPIPGESRQLREDHVVGLCRRRLRGHLSIERSIDAEQGVVSGFRARLDVVVEETGSESRRPAYRRVVVEDEWRFVAVRDGQDAWFRARVADVVGRGREWLRGELEQTSQRCFDDHGERDRSFGSGRIALAVLALLHANVPADDPVVVRAFAVLRRRRLVDTYALATALLALAQRHAPTGERELVKSGRLSQRAVRSLDETEAALAGRWVERLLANLDDSRQARGLARFTYAGGSWADNSLTQYALLGLDAAELCGLKVPRETWPQAAEHFLATQTPAHGRSLPLQLVSQRQLREAAGATVEVRPLRRQARGFAYKSADEPAYGGMTAAGLAGLVLARAGCERNGVGSPASRRAVQRGIEEAFAWFAAEFDVRNNPGFVGKARRHWYYWLYGLERACELAGVAQLQGRDWYFEGAMQLFAQQQPNGAFRVGGAGALQLDSTCFALLFLERSTAAVLTGAIDGDGGR